MCESLVPNDTHEPISKNSYDNKRNALGLFHSRPTVPQNPKSEFHRFKVTTKVAKTMASLSSKSDGSREIYVVIGDNRPRIQLGKIPKKGAERVLAKVESLLSCKTSGSSPDGEVSAWLAALPDNDKLLERLVALELVAARPKIETEAPVKQTIKTLVDNFVIHKRPLIAKNSLDKLEGSSARLTDFLGDDRDIATITVGDASAFESWGRKEGASEAHQRTLNRYAKQVASHAVDHGWIPSNPFRKLKSTALAATARHYVTDGDTVKLLAACPSHPGKVLVGLARYAGLRVPSEVFSLTWEDVDWKTHSLSIAKNKTAARVSPILPQLFPILRKAWEERVGERVLQLSISNIRRRFPSIITAAKLKPWEDMFQALRRSCETHLISLGHPHHVVADWLGHSVQVSKDHYLMVTSEDFAKATRHSEVSKTVEKSGADSGAVSDREGAQEPAQRGKGSKPKKPKNAKSPGDFQGLRDFTSQCQAPPGGLEPPTHGLTVRCSAN